MKVSQYMSSDVQTVTADQSIREAAQFMLRADAGAMPVVDDDRLVGMVTDRDIAVRAVAEGRGPDTPVREAMTDHVDCCFDDDDVDQVATQMSERQIRRMPVKSRETGQLVGIISLADITRSPSDVAASKALDGISQPGGEHNQSETG